MNQFTGLAAQSWTLYAISISLIFSRLIFRRITLGHFRRFQADDWLMVVVLLPYTATIVLANQIGNAESMMERKFRYVLEEMQIITIWLVKACLLVLYWRIFPMGTSTTKRRSIKAISGFCAISFIIVQTSLMLWCQPTEQYWNPTTTNEQCRTYHSHTALTLSFDMPTTILTMLLPVPFIPTPRRTLLGILLLLGTLVLTSGIASSALILTAPTKPTYLYWATSESSLCIIFANLPFLTSFVATAAPARLRHLSSHLSLSQWPRSRRGSWEFNDTESRIPTYRSSRLNSTATAISELPTSPTYAKESRTSWTLMTECREEHQQQQQQCGTASKDRNSAASSAGSQRPKSPMLPEPLARRPETRDSEVPKMRLSGGLAEMGELSVQDTQGWPIYWK